MNLLQDSLHRHFVRLGAQPGVNTPLAPYGGAQVIPAMRVILHHALTGFFYGGPHCWVNGPERAADLGSIEHAIEIGKEEAFGQMEVVAWPDQPECQLVIPLPSGGPSYAAGDRAATASPKSSKRP